jgi:glycine cleavage system H protein
MVVLMVFLTFALCIGIDYILNRRERAMVPATVKAVKRGPAVFEATSVVEGYQVPEGLRYHPGHTWAWVEDGDTVRVGMDDFARRLVGKVSKIELPRVGEMVRQGAAGFKIHRNGLQTELVSPIEGEVVEVNAEALANPGSIHDDPYGKGWLYAVRTPDVKRAINNLIPANMVSAWMGSAARALRFKVHNRVGLAYQDGGEPVEDVVAELGEERWNELTREFLLM